MTAIQDSAQDIATRTRITVDAFRSFDTEISIDAALDKVIDNLLANAQAARTRDGSWRYETPTEQIADALFLGSIARDVRENAFRPSTGPVGDYVRGLLA